mgnify:CR=1 FL=1
MGAALIDDVLGIIALTVISSFAGSDGFSVGNTSEDTRFLHILRSCGISFSSSLSIRGLTNTKKDLRRFVILAFAFCLLMSFAAEYFFGVSDITGAFVAGLILSNNEKNFVYANRFDTVSYVLHFTGILCKRRS